MKMGESLNRAILHKEEPGEKLAEVRRALGKGFTEPVVKLVARTGVSPNGVTWFGFILTAMAALLIILGFFSVSGVMVLIAGFCDTLDGALARLTGRVTRFGAVLDSTLDRASEGILLLAILVFYVRTSNERPVLMALLVALALIGSYLVSYVRARAEGIGLTCEVGISTRTERVLVMVLGLVFGQLTIALAVIALSSLFTAGERLAYVWGQTKKDNIPHP